MQGPSHGGPGKRIRSRTLVLFLGIFLGLGVPAVPAQETTSVAGSSGEYAFLAGYGASHPGWGETRTRVETVEVIGRWGYFLSDERGKGWYRGRHELLVELPLHLAVDPQDRIMTGAYLNGSWKFTGLKEKRLYPYVFAGGGVLYADLGLPSMGSRLVFCYQGGAGLQYLIRRDLAFTAESRYHHISNAGTASPNEPLNSTKILVGISLFR